MCMCAYICVYIFIYINIQEDDIIYLMLVNFMVLPPRLVHVAWEQCCQALLFIRKTLFFD